ncbi:MAG: D-alanyl-D-alanine carboxypeptidase [Oscillospiraceae bacterium]|nr:D-alanyl-D-alanine carboxypeptidase [Oscillospiraceae bacterium]
MKILRKCLASVLIFAVILGMCMPCSLTADAYAFTPPFTINSKAGIVMNLDSGTVVYEKNADHQEMPAHLAQIMTAIVVMENCPDIDTEKVNMNVNIRTLFQDYEEKDDIRYAGIESGDTLTVTEYLYAMMLTSGCEAAYILASYGGNGSVDTFVGMMNEKAAEIGCTGTHFTNPTGLYDQYQITTARDMMLITQYALEKVPRFREIATADSYATMSKSLTVSYALNGWSWKHSNTMTASENLFYYEGAHGIKTGNLNEYGRNIITMATRDGVTYLVILLAAPFEDEDGDLKFYHIEDATALLDWAFSSFQYTTIIGNDEEIAELTVKDGSDNNFVLVKPEDSVTMLWCTDVDISAIQRVPSYNENISAPIKKGDVLGKLDLKFSGEIVASVPLVAVSDVSRSPLKHNAAAFVTFFTEPGISSTFHVSLIFAGLISLAYILLCIYSAYSASQRQKAADAVHIVPRSNVRENNNSANVQKKAWKRSEPVFYHKNPNGDDKEQ